jgi:hypothetical protein
MGPVVAAIDRTRPAKTSTCTAGTIGIHLLPRNILIKSEAKRSMAPAKGKDTKVVNCKTLRYASLSLGKSSWNFE